MFAFDRPSLAPLAPTVSPTQQRSGGIGNAAQLENFGLGPIGPSTSPNINTAPAPAPSGGGMLRRGSTGSEVVRAQRQLNLHGADLVEDGIFGALTDGATREFQAEQGLDADGIIGPLTWSALNQGLAPSAPPPSGAQHQVAPSGPDTAAQQLDEASFTVNALVADTSEFSAFVSMGALDIDLAATLAAMRDVGGECFFSYLLAQEGLTDGSLLGIVHSRGLPNLLQRRLSPNDPDRARFAALRPTGGGAVFLASADGKRGLIVVSDSHGYGSRSEALSLSHELNHFANRGAATQAVEADASHDLLGVSHSLGPSQMSETRHTFVHEMVARHVEWWVAQEIRANRLGMPLRDITPPAPGALLTDCITLALEATIPGSVYDPYGYWATLNNDQEALEAQVRGWMQVTAHESFSGNPYRDMLATMLFVSASTASAVEPGDGLDGDI
jgi:hypothetical protein